MTDLNTVLKELKNYDGPPVSIMEVCGTHTASISENGIPSLLSGKIRLISGPGCPVCVTVNDYIDALVKLSLCENTTVVTFGDMLRVPGTNGSLSAAVANGASVKMVYSPFDTLALAKKDPERNFIFAAVGFETTTPVYAAMLDEAKRDNINNIKLLTALKTMPAAIDFLCKNKAADAYLAPGHVSVITGSKIYEGLAEKYGVPFVVSGFKAREILLSVYALVLMRGQGKVKNFYPSAVTADGNTKAQELVNRYFEPCDAAWRGIGILKGSGMRLRDEFSSFDAGSGGLVNDSVPNPACRCAGVVLGKTKPAQCPLYGKVCTPENPQGSCMVSGEGACYNYFINGRED